MMTGLSDDARAVARGIDDLFSVGPALPRLVEDYLSDDAPRFTGRHFNDLGGSRVDAWGAEDVAAVALLGTPTEGDGVERLLLTHSGHFDDLLVRLPATVTIWQAAEDPAVVKKALEAGTALLRELRSIPGIGWTRAHKLIARKRPELHPVYDSVLDRWFHDVDGIRFGLAELVAAGESPADLIRERLDPQDRSELGALRLLDIAVWMCGSTSPAAEAVRVRHDIRSLPHERVLP